MKSLSKSLSELYYVDSIIYHSKIIELFMSHAKPVGKYKVKYQSCDIYINLDDANKLSLTWDGIISRVNEQQSDVYLLRGRFQGILRELMAAGKHKTISCLSVIFPRMMADEAPESSGHYTISLTPYADTIRAAVNRRVNPNKNKPLEVL